MGSEFPGGHRNPPGARILQPATGHTRGIAQFVARAQSTVYPGCLMGQRHSGCSHSSTSHTRPPGTSAKPNSPPEVNLFVSILPVLALQGICRSSGFICISIGKDRCTFFAKTAAKKPEPSISWGFLTAWAGPRGPRPMAKLRGRLVQKMCQDSNGYSGLPKMPTLEGTCSGKSAPWACGSRPEHLPSSRRSLLDNKRTQPPTAFNCSLPKEVPLLDCLGLARL